jgi:hypothetical protein
VQAGAASFSTGILATHASAADGVRATDRERMRSVAAFTAETLSTEHPMPFGADIVSSATSERLMREVNRVGPDHDPSAHAETLTIRLACAKLGSGSLKGYTQMVNQLPIRTPRRLAPLTRRIPAARSGLRRPVSAAS